MTTVSSVTEVTEQEHEHQRQILKARLLEQEMDTRETL